MKRRFEIQENVGFWGIGMWFNPYNKMLVFVLLKWQFRFYFMEILTLPPIKREK